MQIFSDERTGKALSQYLEGLEAEDFIVVDLEQPDQYGHRSTACGINMVPELAKANPDTPVIMVGWQTPQMYERYSSWKEAIGFKNVVLRRLPVNKDDILSAITEIRDRLTSN